MWSFFSRDPAKDFPYDIGEPISGLENKSIWTLHRAKRKVIRLNIIEMILFFFVEPLYNLQ